MKRISKAFSIDRLLRIKREFASEIREHYEHAAKNCETCPTQGACCLDEHFVNVHISRLEAAAIREVLDRLPSAKRRSVEDRIERAIEKYGLDAEGDTNMRTFACPLFEKGIGCLVHGDAKPLPCIAHACYERKEDLPPGHLLAGREVDVDELERRAYGNSRPWLPLPVAIKRGL